MTLRDVLRSARKHWWWVVLPVVALTLGMGVVSARSTPVYRSTATLYVALAAGGSAGDLNQGSSYTQNQMTSFARLAVLPVTLEPVVRDLDLDTSARQLAKTVAATSPKDSSLLDIAVTGTSPEQTALVANAVAAQLGQVVEALAPKGEAGSTITATVVSEAVAPAFPIAPNTRRNVLAAFLAGLLIGLAAAWARDALDTRVRHQQDLRRTVDVPVLGSIRQRRRPGKGETPPSALVGASGEDFRRVRANLEMTGRPGAPKLLVFTSALQSEGKSFVATRVAASFAAAGVRTLLVDADLRRPTVAGHVGVDGGAGLTDVLVGRAALGDVVQHVGRHLVVLAAGPVPPNPAELLAYPEFGALLDQAAAEFEVVVIDAPPLVPVADAAVIARRATGVVVVADARQVRRPQLRQVAEAVRLGGGRVVGTVLNREKGLADESYGYVADGERRRPRRRRGAPAPSEHAPAPPLDGAAGGADPATAAPRDGRRRAPDGHRAAADAPVRPAVVEDVADDEAASTDVAAPPAAVAEGVEPRDASSPEDVPRARRADEGRGAAPAHPEADDLDVEHEHDEDDAALPSVALRS